MLLDTGASIKVAHKKGNYTYDKNKVQFCGSGWFKMSKRDLARAAERICLKGLQEKVVKI